MAVASNCHAERDALPQTSSHAQNDNWRRAVIDYLAARQAEVAFDKAVWMPAFEAGGGHGMSNQDKITMDRLSCERDEAEGRLVETPSADAQAFVFKYLVMSSGPGSDAWNTILQAEVREFVGESAGVIVGDLA